MNNYTYAHKDFSIVDQKEEVRGGPAVVHLPVAIEAPAQAIHSRSLPAFMRILF
jgi:hypothetical protein